MNAHDFNHQFAVRVKSERKITNEILKDILYAEDHKIHLRLGYSSLFKWLTQGHGYSGSCAQQRIEAARLLRVLPSISQKLEQGSTNLSVLARAQAVFKANEKLTGERLSVERKHEAIKKIENRSTFEAERVLLGMFPEVALAARPETRKVINEDTVRVTNDLPIETLDILDRVRELLSHKIPDGSGSEVLFYLANYFLDREDPLRKNTDTSVSVNRRVKTKSVSRPNRRTTIQKAEGRCEYVDPVTGKVCGSTFQVETDHIRPKARGGGNEAENLRCLCRAHNQFMSEQILGKRQAHRWRNS